MAVVQANASQQAATTNDTVPENKPKPVYGKVVLSLENCILPSSKLHPTPSVNDGLDHQAEIDLRILGCELIQTSGKLLKLPQVAMATGQVLFQRFYYSKSFVRQYMETVSMACVTLASKIEESPRRIRDVANVFHHIKQVRNGKTIQPLVLDQNYINLKNQVIKAERRILKELGFCVHVKHPHKIIVTLLQVLECEKNHRLMQTAWNYMNDSLRSDVFVRYEPEKIACACIYLSARLLKVPLPTKPAWFMMFGVSEVEIQDICFTILHLYERKKPDQEALEKIVEELRKAHQEAKKVKLGSGNNTPSQNDSGFSPGSHPCSPNKNSPLKDSKKEDKSHRSPRNDKEHNHVSSKHKRSPSPIVNSPFHKNHRSSTSSHTSRSPSPRHAKTPPRSYKIYSRSSRSRSRDKKMSKHKRSHKRKRSRSRSQSRSRSKSPAHRHGGKKYKDDKLNRRSRSRDRNHEKSRKSRKERVSRRSYSRDRSHR